MRKAKLAIVRAMQREVFPKVMDVLHNHTDFNCTIELLTDEKLKSHPCLRDLRTLCPYQVNGILRVGGRLQNSSLPVSAKHPILLPTKHPVTDLLILSCHSKEGHMGSSHVLNALSEEFWILQGKSTVKKDLGLCYACKYWKAGAGNQQMAPLPVHRVTPNPPFTACGTDLMGTLYVKIGRSYVKRYVCVFNCLATRAVHFKIVQSLEASAFIQAFRRFCNRRAARVHHVYSDNGGNFVLANKN